ncbi:hypothetical protein HN51_029287 [Arachis hypogaea]
MWSSAATTEVMTIGKTMLWNRPVYQRNLLRWWLGFLLAGNCQGAGGDAPEREGSEITGIQKNKGHNLRWQWCVWGPRRRRWEIIQASKFSAREWWVQRHR